MAEVKIRKMPIGIQNFESLIMDGYLYVDKTEVMYRLINEGRYYFLSRPRRFGKSLMISTLKAFFEGKRDLFEGLAVAKNPEVTWEKHPIFHLDLNAANYNKPESLDDMLNVFLCQAEALYGRDESEQMPGTRFKGVIRRAYEKTGKKAVVLVDEYDKPLLQAIGNKELQETFRGMLKGFYGTLKSMDECICFAILTGVTRFSHVSIFSDLNNLNDISMNPDFADICGITEEELLSNFSTEIDLVAKRQGITYEECVEKLRRNYDGYHFTENSVGVYNPFSLLKTFFGKSFGSYWFETGTPTYLVKLIQQNDYKLSEITNQEISQQSLQCINDEVTDPIPLMFQSGYLTIKGYNEEFDTYTLGFPNKEVEEGFTKYLMPNYINKEKSSGFHIARFVEDVREGNTEQFLNRLRSLFADTPYELVKDLENHYQNLVWLLYKLMGFYTKAEYHTSQGRIDMAVKTPDYCYVMEFKLDGTAEEALAQIQDKNYTLPFQLEDQKIIRIGINFDKQTRNIDKFAVEQ